jgi:Glycosyl transferase family 2
VRLSVVITVVDGHEALERCLRSLTRQDDVPAMEVIVPYDDSIEEVGRLARAFPTFRFLALGRMDTAKPKSGAAGQHELFDRRRSAGLAAARGTLIAILEDRGVPRSDWARAIVSLHERFPHAVIGGAIENGRDRRLNWAVYFCDFGRYQRPLPEGPASYVSDVNICYKGAALQRVAELWRGRYHETTVHWALQRAGETLFLSPDAVVDEIRDDLKLSSLLRERFAWGRLYGYTRARELPATRRLAMTLLSPMLPLLLLFRLALLQRRKGVTFGRFVAVSPIVLILLTAWSLGEMIGYATGAP